ncbi:MAG: metalloprotease TldD, partial [Rhodobacterales bacterium CG_4_9_14_3_um_filter_71_31]
MISAANRFRPFDTAFDETAALAILRGAVDGADDGELFLERSRSESLSFDDGRLKAASYDASEGFGLRAVAGAAAGYAHATEMTEAALRRAAETCRLAAQGGGGVLAAPPAPTNRRLYHEIDPLEGPSFAVKVALLREIDDWLRARDPRVVQVSASLYGGVQEVEILRPEGLRLAEARPLVRLNISVIVEKDGRRETGSWGAGGRTGYDALIAPEAWRNGAEE